MSEVKTVQKIGKLKGLYDWTLHWAHTPYGAMALFAVAFIEASFFPVPPDVLLLALGISVPAKVFRYAAICSVGSVFGGCFGYFIGYELFEHVGKPIFDFYGLWSKFEYVKTQFNDNAFAAIAIAGFTPIPYKVFTISAGVCRVDFETLVLASAISRSSRFFMESVLIYIYGEKIKEFIDRYFNILSIVFVVTLVGGYIFIKYMLR